MLLHTPGRSLWPQVAQLSGVTLWVSLRVVEKTLTRAEYQSLTAGSSQIAGLFSELTATPDVL